LKYSLAGKDASCCRSSWTRSIMMTSASLNGLADVGGEADAGSELREFLGQQRGGAAEHDIDAEFGEQENVGAGDAAVGDVADDGDAEAFEVAGAVEDGAGVEQRLGGMLVGAVAGVDDGGGQVAREESGARRRRSGA
jgi:hypothetical protein